VSGLCCIGITNPQSKIERQIYAEESFAPSAGGSTPLPTYRMPLCRSARVGRDYRISMTKKSTALETRTPFLPSERINLPEALAAFTINAAYTNRLEKTTGSIEVGKNANLIVLDHSLFAIPATEIDKSKVLLTLFEGRAAYGDLEQL
jgi:Amidohydrolase family